MAPHRIRRLDITDCYNHSMLKKEDELQNVSYEKYIRTNQYNNTSTINHTGSSYPSDLNDTEHLVIVPPILQRQDFSPCPYRRLFNEKREKLLGLELLRLVTECFGFYRTEILIPKLKELYPNKPEYGMLSSWEDCKKVKRQDIIEAAQETGIIEAKYDCLHDLRQRRNNLCHELISRDSITKLQNIANEFKIFRKGEFDVENYPLAVKNLAEVLGTLPDDRIYPSKHFLLTNLIQR
ncbi:hypothetical protein I4U23_027596 [Adineta vaga]|nr:hypothetical protein I4U23_027596 [Adineta vaga]